MLLIFFQLFSLHVCAVAHFLFRVNYLSDLYLVLALATYDHVGRFLFIQCNEPYFNFTYENGKTSLCVHWTTVIVLCFYVVFLDDEMTILNMQSSFWPRRTQSTADGTWQFSHFVSHEICARSSLSFHSPVFFGVCILCLLRIAFHVINTQLYCELE